MRKQLRARSLAALAALCLAALSLAAASSCATPSPAAPVAAAAPLDAPSPEARFAVLSDIHLYDPSLGLSGPAWEESAGGDMKCFADSEEILGTAIDAIIAAKPDFALVPGDLTKDGERLCHEKAAAALSRLLEAGIPVYVLPGNHDVDNPQAFRYPPKGKAERVPSVSPAEFASIYARFGYGEALSRDPASLSYLAEPRPGLWLLALDSADYEGNADRGKPETGGRLRPQTKAWLEARLAEARSLGKTVIVSEHHTFMEHFDGMRSYFSKYIVADNEALTHLLVSSGVRLAFSGHFHANSAALRSYPADFPDPALRGRGLCDIETGSLASWPCPYRLVSLRADGSASVETRRVSQLPSYAAAGRDFDAESEARARRATEARATSLLRRSFAKGSVLEEHASLLAAAMLAHFAGDARRPAAAAAAAPADAPLPLPLAESAFRRLVAGFYKETAPKGVTLMEDNDFALSGQ